MSDTSFAPAPLPLESLAHRSGWLPREGDLKVLDSAWIHSLPEPLWVGLVRAGGAQPKTCFVAVGRHEGAWHDATVWPLYQRDFLQLLAARGRLPLASGALVFDAAAPVQWSGLELRSADLGASTNCVVQVALGGLRVVHKVFRHLGAADHEVAACKLLQHEQSPALPRHLGAYRYMDAQGIGHPVGLLKEFFDGRGLHVDLSLNLRALWQAADSAQAPSVEAHLAELLPELAQWRGFLDRFHDRLDHAIGLAGERDAPAFDTAHHAAQVQQRLARLLPQVRTDPLLSPLAAGRLVDLLSTVGHALFEAKGVQGLKAGACHGALHLSHLLWRCESGTAERRLIDASPPALHCSHRLMDWAALARALDYFYLDEATLELKRRTGASSAATMQRQLVALLQGDAPSDDPAILRVHVLGARWRLLVQQALCGEAAASRAWQQFYFARLLHELDYNYVHRRPHFRCIDFHSLLRSFDQTLR